MIWLLVNAKSVVFANFIALNTNILLLLSYYEPMFFVADLDDWYQYTEM